MGRFVLYFINWKHIVMMNIRKIYIYILTLIIISIQTNINIETNVLLYELLIVDIFIFCEGYYLYKNLLHPYNVFLILFNLFLMSRIWLNLIGIGEFPWYYTNFFTFYPFEDVVQQNIIYMLIFSLLSFGLGANSVRLIGYDELILPQKNDTVEKNAIRIMKVMVVPTLIYFIWTGYYIFVNGYIFNRNEISSSLLFHTYPLYEVAFYVFLANNPSQDKMRKYSMLFLFVMSMSLFAGARHVMARPLMVFFTYYSLFIKKISIKRCMVSLVVLVFAFQAIATVRNLNSEQKEEIAISELLNNPMVTYFFASQGVSISVLGYTYELSDEYGELNDVFAPITTYLPMKFDDTFEEEEYYKIEYANKISWLVNPEFYYNGHGAGSSYVAELYSACKLEGIILGNFLLGGLVIFLLRCYKNWLGSFVCIMFWNYLYFMPRGNFLSFVPEISKWVLVILLCKFLHRIFIIEK